MGSMLGQLDDLGHVAELHVDQVHHIGHAGTVGEQADGRAGALHHLQQVLRVDDDAALHLVVQHGDDDHADGEQHQTRRHQRRPARGARRLD